MDNVHGFFTPEAFMQNLLNYDGTKATKGGVRLRRKAPHAPAQIRGFLIFP